MNTHEKVLWQAGGVQSLIAKSRVTTYQKTGLRPNPTVILIGRNELCPCKSGKKFKRCCLGKAKGRAA